MFYIVSYNQIHGFMTGAFSDIDGIFYKGHEAEDRSWTALITEAKGFETAQAAWDFIHKVWERSFVIGTFGVLEYQHGQDFTGDDYARQQHTKRQNIGRLLATKHISAKELVLRANNPHDHGLTYREKWIIEIMSKKKGDEPLAY